MAAAQQEGMERDVRASLEPVITAFSQVCSRIDSNITSLKPEFNDVFMYATVYNIAVDPNYMYAEDGSHAVSELLYLRYQDMLARYAKVLAARAGDSSHLARIRCWRKYKMASRWMRKAFDYLSRYFLHETGKNSKYPSLDEVAKAVFFNCCLKKVVAETRKAVFDLILASRAGQMTVPWALLGETAEGVINNSGGPLRQHLLDDGGCSIMSLCKDAVELFGMMSFSSQPSFFEDHFYQHYVKLLRGELTRSAQVRVAEGGGSYAFIRFAAQTMKEERDRATSILSSDVLVQRTMEALEGALLDLPAVVELLFNSGENNVLALMEGGGGHYAEMAELFTLLKGKPQRLEPLACAFQKHVESAGMQLVKKRSASDSELNPTECISELVVFYKQFVSIVANNFKNHRAFTSVLKTALSAIISRGFEAKPSSTAKQGAASSESAGNTAVISTSELLASHCHQIITTNNHEAAINMDEAIGDAVILLEYTGNRDMFLLHTRVLLARRLLSPAAPQYALSEKLLIARLRSQFGHQFAHCLSNMLTDREVAQDLNESFHAQIAPAPPLSSSQASADAFVFNALALKQGIWPSRGGGLEGLGLSNSSSNTNATPEKPLVIPQEIELELKRFEQYHTQIASRKVLRWAHHLGTATLQCVFNQQLKDFSMTTFQALILLKLNSAPSGVTFETLMSMGLTAEEVRQSTKGLQKIKLLVPSPTSRGTLIINERFSNPARKIQVPSGDVLVSVEASKKLQSAVVSDRKPIVQACVMKVMKGRRQLSHTDLTNECMRQLGNQKMTIEAKSITEAIRMLLEREFLERHPDNHTIYRYVA